jgi:predicted ester cyclase
LRKRRQPPSARTGRGRRKGNWDLYEELFADDLVDHTPVRGLYVPLRAAFPDFRPEIHWQVAAGDLVTTYKTYHGTHQGDFLGIAATGQQLGVVPPLGGQR